MGYSEIPGWEFSVPGTSLLCFPRDREQKEAASGNKTASPPPCWQRGRGDRPGLALGHGEGTEWAVSGATAPLFPREKAGKGRKLEFLIRDVEARPFSGMEGLG